MTRTPRAVTAVCALIAITAFAATPADAATKKRAAHTAVTKAEKKQNAALLKHNRQLKSLGTRTNAITTRTTAAEAALKKAGEGLAAALVDIQANKDGLAGITAAVPTVISSLQALGDGALQLKAGLEQVGAGLTTLAAATTAGFDAVNAGFDQVSAVLAAQEWGQVQVYADADKDGIPEAAEAVAQSVLVTSDIPDDTNQAVITGGFDMLVPSTWTAGGTGDQVPLYLMAAVRSAEVDGTGPTDPVASAGIVSMQTKSLLNVTLAGGTAPSTGQALTSAPNAGLGGLPLYNIDTKAARAGSQPLAFPLAQAIDLTANLNNPGFGVARFNLTNTDGVNPGVVHIDYTVRFSDLTPASPDPLQ